MKYYILGTVLLLLCVILIGFLLKKKHYKEVDRLEEWKMDIMGRPVTDELSKVKQLNMTGQTEQLFENWRQQWDELLTIDLPDVEEFFIDAEEYIDTYRFNKAKISLERIAKELTEAEATIEKIILELNDLVGSEEKNRTEMERLKDRYRETRKVLLARGHTFGKAAGELERQIDETVYLFELFEEKTVEGNYLEARETVLQIDEALGQIEQKMKLVPYYITECTMTLPALLKELSDGYNEMNGSGYILTHVQMEKELERLDEQLAAYLSYTEKTELEEVEKGLEDIKENIDLLFDLLEKEVYAKHFIVKNKDALQEQLEEAIEKNKHLKMETEAVQKSYHISLEDVAVADQIDKRLGQLVDRYELLSAKLAQEQTAQTELSDELANIQTSIETIAEEQDLFLEKLTMLRSDEIAAREKITELSKKINRASKTIMRSNLPGLPQPYIYISEDASESLQVVSANLEEKPLNMELIRENLSTASHTVEKLVNDTEELVADVVFAEAVIQYGNRYRSRYPIVAEKLAEAEISFRGFQYKEALEQAATVIEEVEPGALKRIEQLMNEK